VEALTKEVHVYKILRGHLIQYFGGEQGDPVLYLRAQILLKQNWLRGKLSIIQDFINHASEQGTLEDFVGSELEFRNEEEASKMRPTHTNTKEVSYIKNNPREKEMNREVNGGNGESMNATAPVVMKTA
jgi:hypothetical protein